MKSLATRVDRILNRMLSGLPPGNLTFERAHTPGLITYTLRVRQIEVSTIEIEEPSTASPGARMTFKTLPNSFSVFQENTELILEITNLTHVIMDAIDLELGKQRWIEITAGLDEALQTKAPPPSQQILIEQSRPDNPAGVDAKNLQPWEAVPDHLWDRAAVKLWCDGYTNQEIADKVKVHPRTVTNCICALRRRYPEAGIPTQKQRRKLMIWDEIK